MEALIYTATVLAVQACEIQNDLINNISHSKVLGDYNTDFKREHQMIKSHSYELAANDKRENREDLTSPATIAMLPCRWTRNEHFGGKFDNPCALFSRIYFVSTFPRMLYFVTWDNNKRVT